MATRSEVMVSEGSPVAGTLGVVVTRVLVPVYLLVGAFLKIADASPSHLPAALLKWAGALDVNLAALLRFSIGVELAVAGVVILMPRLARPVAIAMLVGFVPVLIGDLALGASSCGCFGAVQVPPWVTLVIDVGLLAGVVLLGRHARSLSMASSLPTWQVLAAGLWTVVSFSVALFVSPSNGAVNGAASPSATSQAAEEAPAPAAALPADGYYLPKYEQWLGRPWSEVPIAAWIQGAPDDLDQGTRYVMFYRLDCEHCHELMEVYFADSVPAPTLAVAVPERDGFPTLNVQPFPCTDCATAELPDGVDWFLQTPALIRLEDGVVACAAEVSAAEPTCLLW